MERRATTEGNISVKATPRVAEDATTAVTVTVPGVVRGEGGLAVAPQPTAKTTAAGARHKKTAAQQYEELATRKGGFPQLWHHLRTTEAVVVVEVEKGAAVAGQPPVAAPLRRI